MAPATTTGGGDNILIDVFGGPPAAPPPAAPSSDVTLTPGAEEGFRRFLTKSNGILFENEILQIGVKSEFKKNLGEFCACSLVKRLSSDVGFWALSKIVITWRSFSFEFPHLFDCVGRVGVFFGNKSTSPLKGFSTSLSYPGTMESALTVSVKPVPSDIEGGAQVQQVLDMTCNKLFEEAPLLVIDFQWVCMWSRGTVLQ